MFKERLAEVYAARKQANTRYSLRAYAKLLNVDHSTLSQMLKGSRRATVKQIRSAGKALGFSPEEITAYIAAEQVPEASTIERQELLRHWTAEALAVVREREHWDIVQLCHDRNFRTDCRWIASETGVSVDRVNVALTRLLRLGIINGHWRDVTGLSPLTQSGFRKFALDRVREKAAEYHISFGKSKGPSNGKPCIAVPDHF